MTIKAEKLHAALFDLQLSSTYLTMVKQLMEGPKTAEELAAATGTAEDVVRIRVHQLRVKLEPAGFTVSKLGDGPIPAGQPARAYELIEAAAPEPAPVPAKQEAEEWVPDF